MRFMAFPDIVSILSKIHFHDLLLLLCMPAFKLNKRKSSIQTKKEQEQPFFAPPLHARQEGAREGSSIENNTHNSFFFSARPQSVAPSDHRTDPSGERVQQNAPTGQIQRVEVENNELGGPQNQEAEACVPDEQALKDEFLRTPVFGPTSMAHAIAPGSGTGIGGFEATYFTRSQLLRILVNGKIQFMDAVSDTGGVLTASHTQLNTLATYLNTLPPELQARILPFFQWSDDQKQVRIEDFRQRLSEALVIWQETGMYFEINDPCWSDIQARPFFDLNVTEEGETDPATDHLQVRIFKAPTPEEAAEIDQILNDAGLGNLAVRTGIRAYAGTNLGSQGVGATATDENPLNNEMALSSNDLDSFPDNTRGGNNFLRHSVLFPFGSANLTPAQRGQIRNFVSGYAVGDTIAENSRINLRGFASASGSAAFNTRLVNNRLTAVKNEILATGVPEARITLDNRSDLEAEGLSRDRATQDNEQRVEIRIGSGERQNTVAHEFGHIFGLSDEYVENTIPRVAGDLAWHNPTAVAAGITGGAPVENSDNIISLGNTVRPQHYSTFAWALNQLTNASTGGKNWVVKE